MKYYLPILLASLATAADINIFASPIGGHAKLNIGTIVVDDNQNTQFLQKDALAAATDYCIGTNDLPNHECFAYIRPLTTGEQVKFIIHNSLNGVEKISVNPDSKSNDPLVTISDSKGPSPILRPVHKANEKKKVAAKKPKEGANGEVEYDEADDVEEEVDERSWVQKNWMYIVPGLILLFIALGTEEEKK